MESLEIILEKSTKKYSKEEKEDFAEQKNKMYVELLEDMTPADLPKEVKTTLDDLRKQGVLLAIGSSSKNAKRILKHLGLENFFDFLCFKIYAINRTKISRCKVYICIGGD